MNWVRHILALAAIGTAVPAAAAEYLASRAVGAGQLTLRLVTDGKTGRLLAANFLDWTVTVTVGASTRVLNGPNSGDDSFVRVLGNNLSATAEHIFFDFDGTDGYVLFMARAGDNSYYEFNNTLSQFPF